MEITWRVISQEGEEEGETGDGEHKWQVQNGHGAVKDSIGNGEAKELICMTYGHELRDGEMLAGWVYWVEGD